MKDYKTEYIVVKLPLTEKEGFSHVSELVDIHG